MLCRSIASRYFRKPFHLKATTNQQFSLTEYNTLKLSKADYTALKSGNNLPQQYIVELDTLRNAGGCMIRYGKSGKQTLMLAFKQGPEMNLFGILSDSAANSNDIQLTDFNDITGDKTEVLFIIWFVRGAAFRYGSRPKPCKLLDVEISDTKVQGSKNPRQHPIGYTRDIKFNEKGFSSFDNRFGCVRRKYLPGYYSAIYSDLWLHPLTVLFRCLAAANLMWQNQLPEQALKASMHGYEKWKATKTGVAKTLAADWWVC